MWDWISGWQQNHQPPDACWWSCDFLFVYIVLVCSNCFAFSMDWSLILNIMQKRGGMSWLSGAKRTINDLSLTSLWSQRKVGTLHTPMHTAHLRRHYRTSRKLELWNLLYRSMCRLTDPVNNFHLGICSYHIICLYWEFIIIAINT